MKWLGSTATTRCTGGINISLLNQQKATAWFSFRHSLSKSYRRYITQNRVGWTLTSDHNESVAVFSLGKPAFVWQINSKTDLIQPTSPLFSFHLFFISPLLTGMMTVSHNAGQHEPGCSRAECWKACAITPGPLLRALQRWRDWVGEWWAFNTMHNRAPQPQTGTIFTLS